MNYNLVNMELRFATQAHEGQVRKYTGEAYINHPIEVMNIVRSVPHSEEMLAPALLHDCNVPLSDIFDIFGSRVAAMVDDLTDESKPEDGNRAQRKEIDRHEFLERTLYEVEELLKMFEEDKTA